jgi:hypothetical protein
VLEPEAVSSDFVGMVLAYFGCLHRISSNEMSSAGWIILLVAPVVAIVLTLEPSLLLGVFVVGGALIVAAVTNLLIRNSRASDNHLKKSA